MPRRDQTFRCSRRRSSRASGGLTLWTEAPENLASHRRAARPHALRRDGRVRRGRGGGASTPRSGAGRVLGPGSSRAVRSRTRNRGVDRHVLARAPRLTRSAERGAKPVPAERAPRPDGGTAVGADPSAHRCDGRGRGNDRADGDERDGSVEEPRHQEQRRERPDRQTAGARVARNREREVHVVELPIHHRRDGTTRSQAGRREHPLFTGSSSTSCPRSGCRWDPAAGCASGTPTTAGSFLTTVTAANRVTVEWAT